MRENGGEFDYVLLSRPEVAEDVLPIVRRHCQGPVIYYGHDLHFDRMKRQAEMTGDDRIARAASRMEERERRLWRDADLSLYPSGEEADIARALQPGAQFRAVVPYGFDTFRPRREPPPSREIVFVGGFGHPPNIDAAVWFAEHVLPLVREQVPTAHLSIIGSNPTDDVRALGEMPGITVRANVPGWLLDAAYARARVAVVPLRCGAGVKLKVVEALHEGLPLVTTPTGAQGLPGLWQVAAIETDPDAFAASVVRLLTDDRSWATQSAAQQDFAFARFSAEAMAESLLSALRAALVLDHEKAA
jgi:glycosyltransferase involved in cell wall biosynthesis